MIALLATGLLSALFFPLVSPLMFGRTGRTAGHVALVVIRSTPEYILAFVLLQLWGPSMLPANNSTAASGPSSMPATAAP